MPEYHALTYAGGGRWVRAFYVLLLSRVTGGLVPECGNSPPKKAAGKASEALAHFPFPVSPRAFENAATAQTQDGEMGFMGAGSQ